MKQIPPLSVWEVVGSNYCPSAFDYYLKHHKSDPPTVAARMEECEILFAAHEYEYRKAVLYANADRLSDLPFTLTPKKVTNTVNTFYVNQ